MQLNIPGFTYQDLHDPARLARLAEAFDRTLEECDPAAAARFARYRQAEGRGYPPVETSQVLLDVAPHVSRFLARLFGVEREAEAARLRAEREQVIFAFKRDFFLRRVLKKIGRAQAAAVDSALLDRQIQAVRRAFPAAADADPELATATVVVDLLAHERYLKAGLPAASVAYLRELLARLREAPELSALLPSGEGEEHLKSMLIWLMSRFEEWLAALYYGHDPATRGWATFKVPQPLDYGHLVELETRDVPVPGTRTGPEARYRRRDGFDLTDPRYGPREVMSEVDYCILCHERDKDSCSKGFPAGDGYRTNPLGYSLQGCPLDQKISESHLLASRGDLLGALAVIMVDNPMVPGTGHRICNDCMKSCIYQKQDPVNIPQVETGLLTDVLNFPYGFEIYSLLTRWNPLNVRRPYALPYNGMKILVVGLGPAGYTLAHYFLNEGFAVAGIDGLKVEPLPEELTADGAGSCTPIRDIASIRSRLSERVLAGFGGVSEYGITVRWDKNFLTVLYLNLARRSLFRIYDGIRFGGTISVEDAWAYGFDHVCLATGAGKPTFISMKNNLIRGIRKASDFLMALQLTGAGKRDSMANLEVQLPALVIGGGLTAIDTATELMAYYPVQVTKIRERYDTLVRQYGRESVDAMFSPEERERLATFLRHAGEVEDERRRASAAGEPPDFIPLVRGWGGVHIYYRKAMLDSPAYRLNHEEIIKSLEEGITFVEMMNPLEAVPDASGALHEMVFERMVSEGGAWKGSGERFRVPAKTVMVAAGTVPNVMYEREHPGTFGLDRRGEFFQIYARGGTAPGSLEPAAAGTAAGGAGGFFTSYEQDGHYVTVYGDNHPSYAGNVVKAMASAKEGYRAVLALLGDRLVQARSSGASDPAGWSRLAARLDDELRARVVRVNRLTPTIAEIIVRAPQAARKFRPGQFYRLQNYEVDSPRVGGTLLMMEGVALTGAWVDKEEGLISLIALELGASSRIAGLLQPGQRVVVMGPTGSPTEITSGGTVLLLGGGLGNAVLFSIGKAFKEQNSRIIYFAGYKKREDLFKREEIEASADVVVYSVDIGAPIEVHRPQDRSVVGNIVQAMLAYATGELGPAPIALREASRIIAIGSDRMMAAVTAARHDVLKPYLSDAHVGVASINSPMQCMMKAICAQCLQRHVNPLTGREEFVFTCVNQDQLMDEVDFAHLNARLRTNSVMEKLANRWLDYLLEKEEHRSDPALP